MLLNLKACICYLPWGMIKDLLEIVVVRCVLDVCPVETNLKCKYFWKLYIMLQRLLNVELICGITL